MTDSEIDDDIAGGLTLALVDALLNEDGDAFDSLSELAADPDALHSAVLPDATKFADDPPADHSLPARAGNPDVGKPASKEVALAGPDGHELARLVREAKSQGIDTLADVVRDALKGYDGTGPLLDDNHLMQLADAIAGVNATADLLGRSRVRELAEKESVPFRTFAESPTLRIAPPEEALDYFRRLVPSLNLDPQRFGDYHRRQAFGVAASTNEVLTAKVQESIAKSVAGGMSTAEATGDVEGLLSASGCLPSNPQYSEMVFRTNAMDAYNQAYHEEGRDPELAGMFPAWQYLGVHDGRQGKDHEPHFGKFYPATASFAEVRGPRPWNCRCNSRWVDEGEWQELKSKGYQIETNW